MGKRGHADDGCLDILQRRPESTWHDRRGVQDTYSFIGAGRKLGVCHFADSIRSVIHDGRNDGRSDYHAGLSSPEDPNLDTPQHHHVASAACHHHWTLSNTNARLKPRDPQLCYSLFPCSSYNFHPAPSCEL